MAMTQLAVEAPAGDGFGTGGPFPMLGKHGCCFDDEFMIYDFKVRFLASSLLFVLVHMQPTDGSSGDTNLVCIFADPAWYHADRKMPHCAASYLA